MARLPRAYYVGKSISVRVRRKKYPMSIFTGTEISHDAGHIHNVLSDIVYVTSIDKLDFYHRIIGTGMKYEVESKPIRGHSHKTVIDGKVHFTNVATEKNHNHVLLQEVP